MIRYTKEYIDMLLVRFMGGETTIEEEDVLSEYFHTTQDVPEEWRDYQTMFAEWSLPQAPSSGMVEASSGSSKVWGGWRWVAVAAAVAVLLGVFVAVTQRHDEQATIAQVTDEPTDSTSVRPDTIAAPAPKPETPTRRKRSPRVNDVARDYTLVAQKEQQRVEQEIAEVKAEVERVQLDMLDAQLRAQGFVAVRHEDGTIEYIKENEITNYYAYEPD